MSNTVQNGKGSKMRPTNKEQYDVNYNSIDWRVKKTSEEWCKYFDIIVLDPDGWDRRPEYFEQSWNEKITEEEFNKRVAISTISCI